MTYKDLQCQRIETLLHQTDIFDGDPGEDNKSIRKFAYILRDGQNNLYKPNREEMLAYMEKNGVHWWGGGGPTANPLSSQAACLNHLFPFREDAEAVLAIARKINPDIARVLPIETDVPGTRAYIQFEAVSEYDHLGEGQPSRGSNCTSLDALIYAEHRDGRRLLIPIEWKYTEVYGNENKAEGASGKTRIKNYDGLIKQSGQLKPAAKELNSNVYYHEPFYQLMRQTLWAEQMIVHGKAQESTSAPIEPAALKGIPRETTRLQGQGAQATEAVRPKTETLRADDFIHVHVVPCGNYELLRTPFPCSGKTLETTWRAQLNNQSKYWLICPEFLLSQINGEKYGEVFKYLQTRYW